MDIIIEIMRVDAPVPDSPGKWRLGDVVGVREATAELLASIGGVCHVPRKCYLVVTNLPAPVTLDRAKALLEDVDWIDDDLKWARPGSDLPFATRRRWRLEFDNLTLAQKAVLVSPPFYLSLAWGQLQGRGIQNRKTGEFIRASVF